jgi:hypothetical protein
MTPAARLLIPVLGAIALLQSIWLGFLSGRTEALLRRLDLVGSAGPGTFGAASATIGDLIDQAEAVRRISLAFGVFAVVAGLLCLRRGFTKRSIAVPLFASSILWLLFNLAVRS